MPALCPAAGDPIELAEIGHLESSAVFCKLGQHPRSTQSRSPPACAQKAWSFDGSNVRHQWRSMRRKLAVFSRKVSRSLTKDLGDRIVVPLLPGELEAGHARGRTDRGRSLPAVPAMRLQSSDIRDSSSWSVRPSSSMPVSAKRHP